MAYQSDESGRDEVYIQTIPAGGAKYQVSTSGGMSPRWRGDGRELFYISRDQRLMAVPVRIGTTTIEAGSARALFSNMGMTGYVPASDGQRFLLSVPAGGQGPTAPPITLVLDWTAGLKK